MSGQVTNVDNLSVLIYECCPLKHGNRIALIPAKVRKDYLASEEWMPPAISAIRIN